MVPKGSPTPKHLKGPGSASAGRLAGVDRGLVWTDAKHFNTD